MEQAAPLSPAPSNDETYQTTFHHLMRHNATTSFPREHSSRDEMGHPMAHSKYGTPSPQDMQYDRDSLALRDSQIYPPVYDARNSMYAPLPVEPNHQPYSTPETSPPTPSRVPESVITRNGLTIQKGNVTIKPLAAKASRVEKSTSRKKKDKGKASKPAGEVRQPLSELAREHRHIHIEDIGAYVNRSMEVRIREVEQSKTPGKVKRPMNAFMLYRKAYQNLAKELCTQNNHQVVSQVCGSGWPQEPEHVREQFNDWAKLERVNHQEAHPGYKFTPSKPKAKLREEDEHRSDNGDLDDFDWATGRAGSRGRDARGRMSQARHEPPPPLYQGMPTLVNNPQFGYAMPSQSMYEYSNPGKPLPVPYGHNGISSGHYYQQSVHQRHDGQGFVEDVVIRRPPSSSMAYGPPPGDVPYELLGQYPQVPHNETGFDQAMDPGLGVFGNGLYNGGYSDPLVDTQQRWTNPLLMGDPRPSMTEAVPAYGDVSLHDAQLQLLRGQDNSWRVEELDGNQFSDWMDQPE